MALESLPVLHVSDYARGGAAFHFARRSFKPGGVLPFHGHDFSEITWTESGSGVHHLGHSREPISSGWIRLVGQDDVHAITASRAEPLQIANLAFRTEALEPVEQHYGPRAGYRAFDLLRSGTLHLPETGLRSLQQGLGLLVSGRRSSLDLARFLIGIASDVESTQAQETVNGSIPAWLANAQSLIEHNEELLSGGLKALCTIAGRTPDHVNRTTQRFYDRSATGFVTDLRLEHAEMLLRTTDDTITDVAFSSGFANLGYFHLRFRQRYGITPRGYRNRAQGTLRT